MGKIYKSAVRRTSVKLKVEREAKDLGYVTTIQEVKETVDRGFTCINSA